MPPPCTSQPKVLKQLSPAPMNRAYKAGHRMRMILAVIRQRQTGMKNIEFFKKMNDSV